MKMVDVCACRKMFAFFSDICHFRSLKSRSYVISSYGKRNKKTSSNPVVNKQDIWIHINKSVVQRPVKTGVKIAKNSQK